MWVSWEKGLSSFLLTIWTQHFRCRRIPEIVEHIADVSAVRVIPDHARLTAWTRNKKAKAREASELLIRREDLPGSTGSADRCTFIQIATMTA